MAVILLSHGSGMQGFAGASKRKIKIPPVIERSITGGIFAFGLGFKILRHQSLVTIQKAQVDIHLRFLYGVRHETFAVSGIVIKSAAMWGIFL